LGIPPTASKPGFHANERSAGRLYSVFAAAVLVTVVVAPLVVGGDDDEGGTATGPTVPPVPLAYAEIRQ
jgi:hypothetical protein